MAINAAHGAHSDGASRGLSQAQRERAFRAARRHSLLVRVLKIVLPAAAAATLSLYVLPSKLSFDFGGATASVDSIGVEAGNLKMVNPTLSGVHPSFGRYDIRAATALQNVDSPHEVALQTIAGTLVSPDGESTRLEASSGLFDTQARSLAFGEGVAIDGREGLAVRLKSAIMHFDRQLITSDEPVSMTFRGSRIDAQALELYTGQARVIFTGQVRVRIEPGQEVNRP